MGGREKEEKGEKKRKWREMLERNNERKKNIKEKE
jgi:hypothetical protein